MRSFSILNRIDIPATNPCPLRINASMDNFQYPQPDRYPCNRSTGAHVGDTTSLLSVSSTGSISLQLEQVLEREAQEEPFSILNRIDIPATSPRSVKLVGENGPFSILNRIDIPATSSTAAFISAVEAFSILNRIDIPATKSGQRSRTLSPLLSVSSTGSISLQLTGVRLARYRYGVSFSILNRIDI